MDIFDEADKQRSEHAEEQALPTYAEVVQRWSRDRILALVPQVDEVRRRLIEGRVVPTHRVVERRTERRGTLLKRYSTTEKEVGVGWHVYEDGHSMGGGDTSSGTWVGYALIVLPSGDVVETRMDQFRSFYDMTTGLPPSFFYPDLAD
ncbi:MAG TPA: hypothetical protein VIK61_17830, partial [Acidimicrobiia bacterium]